MRLPFILRVCESLNFLHCRGNLCRHSRSAENILRTVLYISITLFSSLMFVCLSPYFSLSLQRCQLYVIIAYRIASCCLLYITGIQRIDVILPIVLVFSLVPRYSLSR